MKKLIMVAAMAIFFCSGFTALAQDAKTTETKQTQTDKSQTVTININGMHCGGCAKTIHSLLTKQKGYINDDVAYPGTGSIITYNPKKTTEDAIVGAIKEAGYNVEVVESEKEEG
jgi:copper chaperone